MSGSISEPRSPRPTCWPALAFPCLLFAGTLGPAVFAGQQTDAAPAGARDDVKEAGEADAAMRKAFAELGDSDATVRDAARQSLMGIERRYLPALQRLVADARPLLPSQAAVLRQIVVHVYCAGEPYDADDNFGFLGVRMQPTAVSVRPAADDDFEGPLPQYGVVIVERLPGFIGNRMLLEGDVILGIAERPEIQFRTDMAFSYAVRDTGAGRTINFYVLRRGRLVKVPVKLDPRPVGGLDLPNVDVLSAQRRQKAENYWRESFAPLLKEGVS
jgi:hypothetical protein